MSISLADRMKLLLTNGDGADIQFLVGQGEEKEVLKAHKLILMAASDVFEAMFRFDAQNAKTKTSSSAEQLQSVEITDIDANVFKVMLSFIYAEDSSGLTGDNLIAVLYAAKKYHISLLAKACADFPLKNELPNVFLAFDQAQLLDEKALRWADEKCRQNAIECSPKNRRSALGLALFKIRFPLITMETFANEIVPSGLLTVEEMFGIYQFNCHPNLRAISELYPLKFSAKNRVSCRQIVLDIEQLSAFAGENEGSKRYSETVYRNGVPWKIWAKVNTKKDSTEKCLGFYLLCTASEEDPNWSCKSSAKLQIVSQRSGTKDLSFNLPKSVYNNKSLSWGFPNFISFAELMDPSKGLYDEEGDKVTLAIDFNDDSLYSKIKSFFGKLMELMLRNLNAVKSLFV
ncbi:hypothetical protein niasHT_010206 [Heterodera trifolii]|uniref:BTB domain-containing protein n=1 Tax=Heterodera trifolii TaxID=157864 RepID=A0ABD2MDQ2_9BILA